MHHAVEALRLLAKKYPNCWAELDYVISVARVSPDIGLWPSWCWAPLAASQDVVSRGEGLDPLDPRYSDVGRMAALAAWRPTQGIYRIDETLLDALWDSQVDGALPVETLLHLPEWCIYVESPGRKLLNDLSIKGFWAHLDASGMKGTDASRIELRLLLDADVELPVEVDPLERLIPFAISLGEPGGTLEASAQKALRLASEQLKGALETQAGIAPKDFLSVLVEGVRPVVSVLLYICSTAETLRTSDGRAPVRPTPKPGRKGHPPRHYPPDAPSIFESGARIGAALRVARSQAETAEAQRRADGERHVLPHVRRAHWHTYLLGPRDQLQRRDVRWMHPIFVGTQAELAPVVHLVKDSR